LAHIFAQDETSGEAFSLKSTVDDHSSSITAVSFANSTTQGKVLITSSADKSIICRKVGEVRRISRVPLASTRDLHLWGKQHCATTRYHQQMTQGTVYDLQVEPTGKYFITAGASLQFGFTSLTHHVLFFRPTTANRADGFEWRTHSSIDQVRKRRRRATQGGN